jgi:hypothetical protein
MSIFLPWSYDVSIMAAARFGLCIFNLHLISWSCVPYFVQLFRHLLKTDRRPVWLGYRVAARCQMHWPSFCHRRQLSFFGLCIFKFAFSICIRLHLFRQFKTGYSTYTGSPLGVSASSIFLSWSYHEVSDMDIQLFQLSTGSPLSVKRNYHLMIYMTRSTLWLSERSAVSNLLVFYVTSSAYEVILRFFKWAFLILARRGPHRTHSDACW